MKITRPTEVTVTFDNAQEASRYLYAYYAGQDAGLVRMGFPILDERDPAARIAALRAAVRHIAASLNEPVPAPDKEHAAPTYISSSGKVHLISEMPTPYLVNVLNVYEGRRAVGVTNAIQAELRRRRG